MEYREQIKKAMDFIEEHLNQEIRAEDAAAAAGFSQYHFQRIFKNETGLPVISTFRREDLLSPPLSFFTAACMS